jgi:hypothetical protein
MRNFLAIAVVMLASLFAGAQTTTVTNEASICRNTGMTVRYCEAAPASDGSSVSFTFLNADLTPNPTFTFHNVTYSVSWTLDSNGMYNATFPLGTTQQGPITRICVRVGRGTICHYESAGGTTTLN